MTATAVQLSKERRKLIAEMLLSEPFKDFLLVITGRMDSKQIEAMNDEASGEQGGTNRSVSAVEARKEYFALQSFVRIANEQRKVAATDQDFRVVEIKPSTII